MGSYMEKGAGSLYCLESGGKIRKKRSQMTIPNGICWSQDGKTMYHIETTDRAVKAFDFDTETGELSNERICIEIRERLGHPDGCCIDNEGKIWIAMWEGWCVARFCPKTNKLLRRVHIPVRK